MSDKKKKLFKLGELFCGPGGIALGALNSRLQRQGVVYQMEHAWANDYDSDTCATYAANICPDSSETVICQDIRKLNIKELAPIDAFAYGFPCNDFSIVGEQKGFHGEFGPLYTYGVEIINRFKPKFFLAENVGGLRNANEGKAFSKIMHDLKHAGHGYNLTSHLYRFEEYSVPQNRHRVIIIGIDKSLGFTFQVPAPTTKEKPLTAKEAIENPPIPKSASNQEITAQSKDVVERLKHIRPGENCWNADLPKDLQLNVKKTRMSQIYRRLDPERPSYTITGSGGGGTHGYHWKENRALTNRERARLQTFPDNFVFKGSKESVRKQIGMAVSPKMSEVIFNAVLKSFAGVKYSSVSANLNYEPGLFDTNEFSNGLKDQCEYSEVR